MAGAVVPRWRALKIFLAMLAVVVGWQLSVIAQRLLLPPPPADPVRIASVAKLEDPVAPTRTPPRYDLTIFLFSDYQCPSCRLLHADLERAVTTEGRIRLVYKDWAVLGERSRRAARLAIAAQWQRRHSAAHDLFMRGATGLDDAMLATALTRSGVDWDRLQRDLRVHGRMIDATLDRTSREARQLGMPGTPTLIIGDAMVSGRPDAAQLAVAIRRARGLETTAQR